MGAVHIMNNVNGPLLFPMRLGNTEGKQGGRMIKLLRGWNKTTDEVVRIISGGGVSAKGKAKGGSAGLYFDSGKLQIGEPLAGVPVHEVVKVSGIRQSQRTARKRKEEGRLSDIEAQLSAALLKLAGADKVAETEHLLDPRSMNLDDLEAEIDGLDGAELADVLSLEYKRPGGARKGAVELLTNAMRA